LIPISDRHGFLALFGLESFRLQFSPDILRRNFGIPALRGMLLQPPRNIAFPKPQKLPDLGKWNTPLMRPLVDGLYPNPQVFGKFLYRQELIHN
jgi:hypothetical protein